MKNKKLIWILLPAVLTLWGIIFFRIHERVRGGDHAPVIPENAQAYKEVAVEVPHYELQLNYDDPFLKGHVRFNNKPAVSTKKSVAPKKAIVKTVRKLPVKWPVIEYLGAIKSNKNKKSLFLLNVNGESWFMATGELREDLKLIKAYEDSAKLRYKGDEEKAILKK